MKRSAVLIGLLTIVGCAIWSTTRDPNAYRNFERRYRKTPHATPPVAAAPESTPDSAEPPAAEAPAGPAPVSEDVRRRLERLAGDVEDAVLAGDDARVERLIRELISSKDFIRGNVLLDAMIAGEFTDHQFAAAFTLLQYALAASVGGDAIAMSWLVDAESITWQLLELVLTESLESGPYIALLHTKGLVDMRYFELVVDEMLAGRQQNVATREADGLFARMVGGLKKEDFDRVQPLLDQDDPFIRDRIIGIHVRVDPEAAMQYVEMLPELPESQRANVFREVCQNARIEDSVFFLDAIDSKPIFEYRHGIAALLNRGVDAKRFTELLGLRGRGEDSIEYRRLLVSGVTAATDYPIDPDTLLTILDTLYHDPATEVRSDALLTLSVWWDEHDAETFANIVADSKGLVEPEYVETATRNLSAMAELRAEGRQIPGVGNRELLERYREGVAMPED